MKFRETETSSGNPLLLGKNAENNDELVREFKGKENIILHTSAPGSPFCVILNKPTKKDLQEAATICASKSQDWRDNKQNVEVHQFTGKDVCKIGRMKSGTWKINSKPKLIKVKKADILRLENE